MRRRFRHPSPVSHRSFSQCLREVGDEVIHIFDADREAEETGGDAAGFAFLFREVGVCLGGRVGDETFYTAQTFCEADESDGFQHAEGSLMAVGIEGEHSAAAAGLPVVDLFVFEAGKTRIEHLRDLWMAGKPLSEGLGIFLRSFHAKCQCLDAAGDEPAVPWREAAADGLVEETDLFRDLFVLAYDKAREGVIVSGEILGAAVEDDVGAEVDRIAEVRLMKVLSAMRSAPRECARSAIAEMSVTCIIGFVGVSM